jgi:glycosyltransferase involved in cell wall biosynthesis
VIPTDSAGIPHNEYLLRCKKYRMATYGMAYKTAATFSDVDIIDALEAADEVQEFLTKEKIDLVHSVQLNVSVELAARKIGIPHIMNVYQLLEADFNNRYLDIYPNYHSCDSNLYCELWRKSLQIESCCIRTAAPMDEIVIKKENDISQHKLLMLGTLFEHKNQLTAIKAVASLLGEGYQIKLTIAGFDNLFYAEQCRDYINENGLADSISLLGFISDVSDLLLNNDCYLCASTWESFPSSMVESITYDLAVISTPVAGVPELMKHRENAYLSKGYSVSEVAEAIRDYLKDAESGYLNKVKKNARITWRDNFSRHVVRKKLHDYYDYVSEKYENNRAIPDIQNIISDVKYKLTNAFGLTDNILTKCLYCSYLNTVLTRGSISIWGAGKYGERAYRLTKALWPDITVLSFIDKNKEGSYCGVPIIKPDEIDSNGADFLFLSFFGDKKEVIDYIAAKGYILNETAWILL